MYIHVFYKTTHRLFLEGLFLRKPQLLIVRIVCISQVRVTTMLALLSTSSYEIEPFGGYSEEIFIRSVMKVCQVSVIMRGEHRYTKPEILSSYEIRNVAESRSLSSVSFAEL